MNDGQQFASRAEARRVAHAKRREQETFSSSHERVGERHFKVIRGIEHVAYVTAIRDGCRYNVTEFNLVKDEYLGHTDRKEIRRMIESGQCDQGEVALYFKCYNQRVPQGKGKEDKIVNRRVGFEIREN